MITYQERLRNLYNSDKFEEALKLVLDEEQKQPKMPEILAAKAALFGILGKYEEAIVTANESMAINPDDFEVLNTKGVSLYRLGKFEDAIVVFDACLAIKPNFAIAIQMKISALMFLGEYAKAARAYEESDLPELEEDTWLNNLGFMYLELSDYFRASYFLYRAKRINPFESVVYCNLARIHQQLKNHIRYFIYRGIFLILIGLRKTGILEKIKYRFDTKRPHISEAKFFTGSGRLFSSKAQIRETRSILKLLRDLNATALCNDAWQWFAVNIPYEAVQKNGFKGDIDIILKRSRHFGDYDAGFTYRGFQVKTVVIDRLGNIKSANRGKSQHRDIKKQLNVLKKFGCEQVFLLELFVLERGYSSKNDFPSKEIKKEIVQKEKFLQRSGYGYVVMAEEPSTTHDDESGGMVHMPINILPASSNSIGANFLKLVDGIDTFFALPSTLSKMQKISRHDAFGTKVGYCLQCKRLTMLVPIGFTSHICLLCGAPAY